MFEYSPSGEQFLLVPTDAVDGTMLNLTVTAQEDSIVEDVEEILVTISSQPQYLLTANIPSQTLSVDVMDNDGTHACM